MWTKVWPTNPEIDEIYDAARSEGAIGGKITGAGGGGFLLLFVPPERQGRVREKLNRLLHVPFSFEGSGSQVIFFDPEEDYSALEADKKIRCLASFRELDELEADVPCQAVRVM